MYQYDITYVIAFNLNLIFIIFMPLIFKYGNIFVIVIWMILGIINAIYICFKNAKMKKYGKKNKAIMLIEDCGGVSIKNKFWKAIKDAIIIILIIFLVATVLDYMNLNISLNKYGDKFAKLELINIYKNNNLNGLLTLGFILAGLSFVYDMFLKKETKEVKRK